MTESLVCPGKMSRPGEPESGGSRVRPELVLFCMLIFLTVAFSRDFAHLHLRFFGSPPYAWIVSAGAGNASFAGYTQSGGVPLFATEIFLLLILGSIALRRWQGQDRRFERTPLDPWFALWALVGLAELLRTVVSPTNLLLALRDFGAIYYCIFFFLAREVFRTWYSLRLLMLAFVGGTVLRICIANWYYIHSVNFLPGIGMDWPAINQYMSGINGAFILLAVVVTMALWRWVPQRLLWLVFSYLSVGTFTMVLTQQRSLLIALAVAAAWLTVGAWSFRALKPLPLYQLCLGAVLAGTVVWCGRLAFGPEQPALYLAPIRQLVTKSASTVEVRSVSTTGVNAATSAEKQATPTGETKPAPAGEADSTPVGEAKPPSAIEARPAATGEEKPAPVVEFTGTARFRQDAWREAWRRFMSSPVLGEGFGREFVFFDAGLQRWWTQDVRPHNTYLTILYKMGLVGIGIFTALHVVFYGCVYRECRQNLPLRAKSYLLGLVAALIGFQVYGFFNLLIESPFLALVYWSLLGVIWSLMRFGPAVPCPE